MVRLCDNDSSLPTEHEPKENLEVANQWSWRENNGQYPPSAHLLFLSFFDIRRRYVPFDPDQNFQIELAYISNPKGKITVTGDIQKLKNGAQYEINFADILQILFLIFFIISIHHFPLAFLFCWFCS